MLKRLESVLRPGVKTRPHDAVAALAIIIQRLGDGRERRRVPQHPVRHELVLVLLVRRKTNVVEKRGLVQLVPYHRCVAG